MSIQYTFLTIPAACPEEANDRLNTLLRSVRLLNIDKEFVALGERSFWCLAVSYLPDQPRGEKAESPADRKKIDYREVLSPDDFALFARLREWRKEVAAREAVPVYTIFTNDQLAKMVTTKAMNKTMLAAIEGVGEAKLGKYGEIVLAIISQDVAGGGAA